MIRIVLYLILLMSIIHMFNLYLDNNIDDEFIAYEKEFIKLVEQYCKPDQYFYPNHVVEFSDLSGDTIGICYRYPNRFLIQIDKLHWDNMSYDDRLQLYFHEASHCLFGEEHSDDDTNYMYYRQLDIPRELLYNQVRLFLRKECQK